MNNAHRKTLQAIFARPTPKTLEWRRIEALLVALGCARVEGPGSAVQFHLREAQITIHRPHPGKEAKRYQVRIVRAFLEQAGEKP